MKAWRVYAFGDIRLDEIPSSPLPPGWVRVNILMFQPSITEVWAIRGSPSTEAAMVRRKVAENAPVHLFGHEFCGQVTEVSPGITDLAPGDRVGARGKLPCGECALCTGGSPDDCRAGPIFGLHMPGCFASEAIIPRSALVKLTDGVSDSAGVCVQPLSSILACITSPAPPPNPAVVMVGLGLMGLMGIQAVRRLSPRTVIGISRRKAARDLALELGADQAFASDDPDLVSKVREACGGSLTELVFECSGRPGATGPGPCESLETAISLLADRGQIVEVSTFAQPLQINVSAFRHKSIRLVFPDVAGMWHLQESVRLIDEGIVKIEPIAGTPLDGIEKLPEALEMMLDRSASQALGPIQVRVQPAATPAAAMETVR